jgi:hypothetical protein
MEPGLKRNVAIAVVAVGLIALGVALWNMRSGGNTPNAPEGTFWICSNDQCKHEFNLSVSEVADHHKKHYGEPIPCPKCKSRSIPAERCPHCKKLVPKGRGVAKCPYCAKPLYEAGPGVGD